MGGDQGQGCHSERPWQAGGKGQQELCEIQEGQMQRPAPGKEEVLVVKKAGDGQAGEERCWKLPGWDLVGGDHQPAVCPDSKASQHPRLHEEQQSQDNEGSDYHTPP